MQRPLPRWLAFIFSYAAFVLVLAAMDYVNWGHIAPIPIGERQLPLLMWPFMLLSGCFQSVLSGPLESLPVWGATVTYFLLPFITGVALYTTLRRDPGQALDHLRCLKCGHILKGLTEPRCPECGTRI